MSEAAALVEEIQRQLQPLEERIRQHAYLQALETRRLAPEKLRCFVGEQWYIIRSDLRSIALLVSRCESELSQRFFRDVLQGEAAALEALEQLAQAAGMPLAERQAYEPTPGAQAYSAYLAWLCLYASDAEVAAALAVNFAAWGANCGRMARALEQHYGFAPADLRFFTQFAAAPAEVSPQALAVIDAGLRRGVERQRVVRAARLLQGYELLFWDTLYTLSTA
ncbi:MAG: hypothetical protein KatS3mg131_0133 [Candidatus Tectimicrobiota bacterium]|nr:MAG: hypothetical protein KatS3mg131_0133 [Candidatus Tectomicrobia bacterium]